MKKGLMVTALVLVLILAGGFLYLRYHVLDDQSGAPRQAYRKAGMLNAGKPIERSDLDLRPALVAKLQKLVKEGSDGLYLLGIDSLEPQVLASKIRARGIKLRVDTSTYKLLAKNKRLPDDVFKISVDAMEIDGLGISDLLNTRKIDLKGIYLNGPTIEVYHQKRAYNAAKREREKEKTLYEKLSAGMDKIAIGKVGIRGSKFVRHNITSKDDVTTLKDVNISVEDILIDSSTQYDKHRFLFAKHARLESNDYTKMTVDGLYLFRVGTLIVEAAEHKIIANNITLIPNGGKAAFERRNKTKEEMFDLKAPSVVISDIDWWALMNGEEFLAGKAAVSGGSLLVYLDKTKPNSPGQIENFPQQLLMRLKTPVNIKDAAFSHFTVTYEELNPGSGKTGSVSFNNMDIQMDHITNIPAEIVKQPKARVRSSGMMMGVVPMKANFDFDLRKQLKGAFAVDLNMSAMSSATANIFSEPLGMVTIKSGQAQKATAHISGDNRGAKGTIAIAYTDLHIRPLKKDKNDDGKLKNKTVTGLLANFLFVKDNNPGRDGKLRQPEFEIGREPNTNFFSMVWAGILKGMLKSIGIPSQLTKKA